MRVTLITLYPVVKLSSAIARLCLRLVGIKRQQNVHEHVYTPEELQLIVEESQEGGALRAESGRLLRELFEFGELTAGQVMVPRVRVAGIPLGAYPATLRRIVGNHEIDDLDRRRGRAAGGHERDQQDRPITIGACHLDC